MCKIKDELEDIKRENHKDLLGRNPICYWCGNTNITWYNTGEGADGEWGTCWDHDYRNGELSIYAEEALKKFK